jgi:hypothetical protein
MKDYATDKRTSWIREAQQMPWIELLTFWDFWLIFILLQLIIAICVFA